MKIKIDSLGVNYGAHRALDDVSFEGSPGEVISVIGPNGSGKSTLIKCIAQVQKPTAGKVLLNDADAMKMDPNQIARLIGYVPQNFHYLFFSTVMETVLLGRKPHIRWKITPHDLEVVESALDSMNILDFADKFMDQLSGGEKQKVYIARALAQEPELFLFDEPTSNLDLRHQIDVLEITRRLTKSRGASMIVALHDLNLAYSYSDTVIVLNHGRVHAFGKPADVLTPETIRDVYGVDATIVESDYGRHIVPLKMKS
ncbi:MAG TPA: ABC transporter ATP-binding protein [Methanocella sp.]|jgi:iron complex transport system ATP-binding protein